MAVVQKVTLTTRRSNKSAVRCPGLASTNGGGDTAMVKRLAPYASVFLRVTLGVGFFAAVADRFGLLGAPGATNVAWGDFGRFTAYTATLNPWASDSPRRNPS